MIFLLIAMGATFLSLLAGIINFWRAGNGERSNFWMRTRLLCQGLALAFFAMSFYKGL